MKKIAYILFFVLMGMNLTAQNYVSYWDGSREAIREGAGTEEDPYIIRNAQQFAWLVYLINWDYGKWASGKYFLLTTDIDLNGGPENQWIPIGAGSSLSDFKAFNGVFDGGFHKITGLYIDNDNPLDNETSVWYGPTNAAFFSSVGNGVIKNLYLEGTITNSNRSAGFSGQGGVYEYCVSNVELVNNTNPTGGIVVSDGTVRYSANLGNIKGGLGVGGVGGFKCTVENSYNMGRIEGIDRLGGIAGYIMNGNTLKNCYNVGDVVYDENVNYIGAIVSVVISQSHVENCYYLEGCVANPNEYGEPKTAEFMRSDEFVNLLNNETDVWVMDTENTNDGYPVFGNTPYGVDEILSEFSDVVVVYPNPVTDYVCVVGNVTSCDIYDIVGKRIKSVSSDIDNISVTDLQSGIYMMRFVTKNWNVVTKKIVKR